MSNRAALRRILAVLLFHSLINPVVRAESIAISANPSSGNAPLTVSFLTSSADLVTYSWNFGDGAASTAANPVHVYAISGTYTVTLKSMDSLGAEHQASTVVNVTGSDRAPVTENMSFRWAIRDASFKLNFQNDNADTLSVKSAFSSADLPTELAGLAFTLKINGIGISSGILDSQGVFQSPESSKPSIFIELLLREQTLNIFISKASLGSVLALSGANNQTITSPGIDIPVAFAFTVGVNTNFLTENFNYRATSGKTGRGKFNIQKNAGSVNQGSFVITRGSAKETNGGETHYLEFDGILALPLDLVLQHPKNGVFQFRFSGSDVETVLFDRIFKKGNKLTFEQEDRDLAGVRRFTIDIKSRTFSIATWDIKRDAISGGTGIPVHDAPSTEFFFELRFDLEQPDGSTFRGIAATLLTRREISDGNWDSGRK
jgi:hypothetical protein